MPAPMQFTIKAYGVKPVVTRFSRMSQRAGDARPAFETIADLIRKIEDQTFQSQGRRGGGSWRKLSREWLLRKQRHDLDPRIGHATLALRHSMTKAGDPNAILRITKRNMEIGSRLAYARKQQRERPYVKLTTVDRRVIRGVMREHLMKPWRERV